MYIKLMLGGKLVEERLVNSGVFFHEERLQIIIQDMLAAYENEIDQSDDQPQFLLEENSSKAKRPLKTKVRAALSFLLDLF